LPPEIVASEYRKTIVFVSWVVMHDVNIGNIYVVPAAHHVAGQDNPQPLVASISAGIETTNFKGSTGHG